MQNVTGGIITLHCASCVLLAGDKLKHAHKLKGKTGGGPVIDKTSCIHVRLNDWRESKGEPH